MQGCSITLELGNCTSVGCEKIFLLNWKFPKKCEVLGGTAITLNKNGGTQSSNYTVRANTTIHFNIQTANTGTSASTYVKHEDDGSVRVPTAIVTK